MQKETSPFICLYCSARLDITSPDFWECSACARRYPVVEGIPLLVRDPLAHEAEMAEAQSVKPGWYCEEQPAEDISPWRHHLKKRRLYVEGAIKSYLDSRGLARVTALLDLGCGDGNHLLYLQHYAQLIFGSDYNLTRLARAAACLPEATLFLANILDYPSCEDYFDIVFFNHVIEHIHEDEKALAAVFHILKPGGLLVLGTPNEGAWWWQLAYKRQPKTLETTDHVHFYTSDLISDKMVECGFEIKQIKHLGWGPPDWNLDMRVRQYKWVDDLFELIGKVVIPKQASSLYVIASKPR